MCSFEADARIDDGVENIVHEEGDTVGDAGEVNDAHDDGAVLVEDGLDDQLAHAGNLEEMLEDERAKEKKREGGDGVGDDGDHDIAENVGEHELALGEAFGARGADVIQI